MTAARSLLTLGALPLGLLAGCAGHPLDKTPEGPDRAASGAEVRQVRSADGRHEGEISGTPAPDSRFAKLQIGMTLQQAVRLIGSHDQMYSHETGKQWIPFYLGADARRMKMLYRGEGCLTFTGGNILGGGTNELIRIDVDPAGKCYQP